MTTSCCNLVGDFTVPGFLTGNCIISINSNITTESSNFGCTPLKEGYRVGSLNVSGYAGNDIFTGCKARAGVQILWARKYDCNSDTLHFIYSGAGRSFKTSTLGGSEVFLNSTFPTTTKMINASAQSGPGSIYTDVDQDEGIGMNYTGEPISFDTNDDNSCIETDGGTEYYLQNFNIEYIPGSIPVANYTFAFAI